MSFLAGRVSYLRFRVNGPAPRLFGQDHLDKLADHAAGRQRTASADGVETGWAAGGHVFDTDFDLAKNVVNDALCFELRVDADRVPADLLKAYYEVELKAMAKGNPSGFPSAKQKREAKEVARERLEEEAKDGRFRTRKCFPVLWDRLSNGVLFGVTSAAQVDRLCSLFEQTFGMKLEIVTAGTIAVGGDAWQKPADLRLSEFVPGPRLESPVWLSSEEDLSGLGNEFLLWLWYYLDVQSDTLALNDKSEATVMLARTLALDCPRGQTGRDTFTHEGPARLPEARRAIQAGKLPRKAGLTVVRHDEQFEFTLHAETLAVGSAKLPPPPEDADARGRLDDRVTRVRALVEVVDLLFGRFLSVRLAAGWADELAGMRRWLQRERAAA